MTPPTAAERALYVDLTQLLQQMRGESYARVEAAIESRFHAFLRAHHAGRSATIEITHAMTVHDEAEPWAVYRTEYRIVPASTATAAAAAEAEATAEPVMLAFDNVVPFPQAFRRPQPQPGAGLPADLHIDGLHSDGLHSDGLHSGA